MTSIFQGLAFSALAMAGTANAAEVLVSSDITTSTTWTADNTYNLQGQIYVQPGASLTIEAGTRVASDLGGSLAVAKGAQIFVNGTADEPVVMTSKLDDGTWREAANEWGNLTIMGDAFISEDATPGNVPTPSASNVATMEGLGSGGASDLYGGGNDDDDSGTLNHLSIRFGGKVVSLANELNGLSLGGIGRGTDIDHVEIMNNVDDGIEIWGGTVNLKHASVWNVGDDSFDVDQGWRGKAQFVFIVQGYSLDASQGSGVGDNAFETDGAEDSDWQPVTTAAIYNATVIGQPIDGDGLTVWRDNARVQYHQSVFMDGAEAVVKFDNLDGDGAQGYGHNGTLSWADTWTTSYTQTSTVNPSNSPAAMYQAQTKGNLAGIYDSVFFRNLGGSAYTEANARGVFDAANDNVQVAGFADADAPIKCLIRGAIVSRGGKNMVPVTYVDPRAANDAVSAVGTAPADGFYDQVTYRGAFSPETNWLKGWSAADEFGFLTPTEVLVSANITTSETWTCDKTYNLQGQIYVEPGATLTIEAGTRVASDLGGSLAVAKGAQIVVNGTASAPVVMTSKLDDGTWREAANEWGNLTIMGDAYISEDATPGNVPTPSASNVATMEGLGSGGSLDLYGGGNDDDDSGTLNHLSIRFGGKVVSLANELNGLSLGGIGRGTDIDHVEIMNNVDDGIEIWGGTVNLKHASIWNVGDDSFDVDQGWRGKGQYIFIVQGYSLDASQGSGVGDNAFETDGAEDSDWQPVTTAAIYNATVIGQPVDGDGLTAWRDNARVQYHQSVFMDGGEAVVKFDNLDGDGAQGYGHNGTLSWADTWTTGYTQTSTVNPAADPASMYQAQTTGNLAGIYDSVFFRNLGGSAYTEASARGVFDAANDNVQVLGFAEADAPIRTLVRGAAVSRGGKTMVPVAFVDPRAANDAAASVGTPPTDGFYDATTFRGAFSATDNWLEGWSAADEFGFLTDSKAVVREGSNNVPFSIAASGKPVLGNFGFGFTVSNPTASCEVTAGQLALVFISFDAPLTFPLVGFGCGGGAGDVLIGLNIFKTLTGLYLGAPVTVAAPIPADPAFAGLPFSAQAAFAGPGVIRLGSAVDVTLGTF